MSGFVQLILALLGPRAQALPPWVTWDAESRSVTLAITAGSTSVNSGWNFNGASHGELTVTVPVGVNVTVDFSVRDAGATHSVGFVIPQDTMPSSGDGLTFAAPGAFSAPFVRGLGRGQSQRFHFTVEQVGRYWMFCGVPPHGVGGMWNYFVVSDSAESPSVTTRRTGKRRGA